MTESNPSQPSSGESRQAHSAGRVLAIVLPVALVGLGAYWWSKTLESKAHEEFAPNVVGLMFISEAMPTMGKMEFPDEDHDLVADPPKDPAKLINPNELVFSYVATEEKARSRRHMEGVGGRDQV